jgi:predicted nucleic acid-binding protein
MTRALALLDSNVLIASAAQAHEHHEPSASLINASRRHTFAVAAHSYAEAFSTLTRRSPAALFQFPPGDVMAALESIAGKCVLVGLTHGQTFDALRDYAADGGIGPRLYDKLIGQAAVSNAIDCIVTWNVAHMRGLFPSLKVVDPRKFAAPEGRATKPAKPSGSR